MDYSALNSRHNQIEITSNQQVFTFHEEILAKINALGKKKTVLEEWLCLLNLLKKNLFIRCFPQFLDYPFVIKKSEEPDFVISFKNGQQFRIEITKITTQKNEVLKHELDNSEDDVEYAEVSTDLYSPEVPKKGEMQKNLVKKGEDLQGNGMLGWYAEKQWAKLVVQSCKNKATKGYSSSVDMLLFDDQSLHYNYKEAIKKRFEFLKIEIAQNWDIIDHGVFPYIISDTPGTLGLIHSNKEWLCKPVFLPEDWKTRINVPLEE